MAAEDERKTEIKGKYNPKLLLGVCHGAEFGGQPIEHHPSESVVDVLEKLPVGSRVGIEFNPFLQHKLESKKISGDRIEFSKSIINYWKEIVALCKAKNIEVVYLDNFEMSLLSACHSREAEFAERGLIQSQEIQYILEDDEDNGFKDEHTKEEIGLEIQKAHRLMFVHETISEYLLKIEREHYIFDRIREQPLDVAILGAGHTDFFASIATGTMSY